MKPNTLTTQASHQIPGFLEFHNRLVQSIAISGKSDSMRDNYSRHLARMALHFGCVPTQVSVAEIKAYLYLIKTHFPSASEAYFKFTVYSLRYAYRMEGLMDKHIAMPSIKHDKKLPVVLSKREMKLLLETPKLQKHRLLLGLLYGCGLRCMEVRSIRLVDLDFDRKMLHVRQGKRRKDRYVPLSEVVIKQLKTYISKRRPEDWLFNGKPIGRAGGDFDARYSQRGIQWIIKHTAQKANIHKPVSVHTLRHTFATHLLEDGLDIVTIKELLGHSRIDTTMVYLHVVQLERQRAFSPLDTLYGLRNQAVTGNTAMTHEFLCPAMKMLQEVEPLLKRESKGLHIQRHKGLTTNTL